MNDNREWNPYGMYTQERAFPWLYPYGGQMNYYNMWNLPERMEEEMDKKRLRELYPLMARRLQPYVEEVCACLEYPGSMMYDEYPDQLSLLRKASEVWDLAREGENFGDHEPDWKDVRDLIGVLLLQEMIRRRRRNRGRFIQTVY